MHYLLAGKGADVKAFGMKLGMTPLHASIAALPSRNSSVGKKGGGLMYLQFHLFWTFLWNVFIWVNKIHSFKIPFLPASKTIQ